MYNKGFDAYVKGNWKEAKDFLERVTKLREVGDNPSNALLDFMKSRKFQAPADWKGCHGFGEK